jgi:hypothetical protein
VHVHVGRRRIFVRSTVKGLLILRKPRQQLEM